MRGAKSDFDHSKSGVGPSKNTLRPSKTGVRTKNFDHGTVDLQEMSQLRCTGSKGLPMLRRREFHDGMGRKSTFRSIQERTGTGAARREPGMISSATPTTTTTVLLCSTYYTHYSLTPAHPAGRFHLQLQGVGVCG